VPLSEHEQRVLEQIERALYADDPKFAATVRGIDPRTLARRRYVRAIAGLVIGVALLPVGIALDEYPISVAGFLLALTGVLYGVATWRRTRERDPQAATAATAATLRAPQATTVGVRRFVPHRRPTAASVKSGGFMQRIEARWNRRREAFGNGGDTRRRDDFDE